MQYKN